MRSASAQDQPAAHRLLDILVVVFALLAVALRPVMPAHGGEGNLWVAMCVFIALMAWALQAAFTRRLRWACTGMGIPLAVLLVLAILSTVRSPYKAASLATLLEWLSYAGIFVVIVNAQHLIDHRVLLRMLWASTFVVVLYGILQQYVNLPLLIVQIEGDPSRVQLELRLQASVLNDLVARAHGRIFSTFLLANCFAGFLVVVIPGFVGHVLDRLRAGHRGLLFLGGSALWLAAALACLVFTYSKGGWLAFGLASALFVLLLGRKVYQRHAKALMLVLAAGALLAAALLGTGVVPTKIFADVTGSFDVRAGYWRGAADMARDNLFTGVGLGTYGAHYPRYRHVAARVAQQAHNDYLQVLAELGIVGLVAFLGLWAMYVRNLASRTPTDAAPEPRPRTLPAWLPYLLGLLAIALSNTVDNAFLYSGWGMEPWWHGAKAWYDWGLALALALEWMLIYKALGGVPMPRPGSLCHKGLLCGAIGFLLHCLVDFDYYEPGVVFTAWVVVALSVKPLKRLGDRALSRRAALSLGVVAILAMIAFQLHLTHTVRGAAERDLARRAVTDATGPASPEPHARLLGRARRHFEAALSSLPLDDTLCLEYADLLHSQLMLAGYRDPSLFAQTASLYTRAATLNRASPAPRMRLAALFEQAADAGATATLQPYVERLVAGRTLPRQAHVAYLPAVNAYRAAAERDPLRPALLLQQAIVLEKYGDRAAALAGARRALELHDTVLRKHPAHVMRLDREELPRARALLARLDNPRMTKEPSP